MSPMCKALKMFCFLAFTFSVVNAILGVGVLMEYVDELTVWVVSSFALTLLSAAFGVVFTVVGIQAANTPRKAERARTWGWVAAITSLFGGIVGFVAFVPSFLSCLILLVVCLLGAIWANAIVDEQERKLVGASTTKATKKGKRK